MTPKFYNKSIQKGWEGKKGEVNTKWFEDARFQNIAGLDELRNLSAIKLQQKINDYFSTKYPWVGQLAVDDKWGEQSDLGLYSYLSEQLNDQLLNKAPTKNGLPASVSTPINNPVQPSLPEKIQINAPVYTNFNRSDTRDFMRNAGLNPYDYTGAQRKALRKYLNGESNDTSLLTGSLSNFIRQNKLGGNLIHMTQKYQQGGAAPQGDPQEQIIQLVQAAMGGDQQASAQIQQIMQAAQQGDQQAAQLAEMIMQIANQMQGGVPEQQAQVARNGAKLNYIKRLKGECPDGYEMTYFKAGGKVCKKCQKKVEKACGGKTLAKCGTKFHKAGGVMESILSEMFAKGGAMNRNKHTAFGEEKGANVVSTNHAGRWGGRRAFNERGTHNLNPHDKPNKFTAFGDEGKKKPTNVGLVGHKATGKTGRMQNRQKAGTTYKATAFGGEKQKRFHRGAKASSIGRIGLIKGYPKGHGGKSGIGKI